MRIWIVNYYTSPNCSNPRYNELARHFIKAGHEVITFNAGHTSKIEDCEFRGGKFLERQYGNLKFVHVRVSAFEGNGVKRMISIWQFARIIKKGRHQLERPDIILHNIHPPFDYSIVKLARKLKCKYIAEAWDLWPESFVRFGLIKESNPLMKIARFIEKKYYYAADEIVYTLAGGVDYLKSMGWTTENGGKIDPNHVHYINNGIDLAEFDKNKIKHPRLDEDMNATDTYKIVYLGSVSKANHVQTLIDAAAILKENHKYRFFIYGNGAHRDYLEQYVKNNYIGNVVFKEKRIPLEECAWVVSQATVNVMNYEKGYGKWGASSGKMFQYLAAGKPIVCNVDFRYDNVIKDNNLGISKDMTTSEVFADAIRTLSELPKEEYDSMCKRVREVARRFDYKELSAKELEVMERTCLK